MVRRIQIHLDEDVDDALARLAAERGMAKAAVIREYLAQHVEIDGRRRGSAVSKLIGIYQGSADESQAVDEVLYGP